MSMKKRTLTTSIALIVGSAFVLAGCAGSPVLPVSSTPAPEPPGPPIVHTVAVVPPPQAAAPSVAPRAEIGTALVEGIASFVGPKYGSAYLALPAGRGITATICAGPRCVTRVSTDAGPALFLQRRGRIADLSYADFRRLCVCDPYVVGLIHVSVEEGVSPTLPPTDEAP